MKTVKTKFKCNSVTTFEQSKQVNLTAVVSGSEENKSFAKYTPNGTLSLNIDNETSAADLFSPGKKYYLTIEVAE